MKTSKDYQRELDDLRKNLHNVTYTQQEIEESKKNKPGFFEGMDGCVSFILIVSEFLLLAKMVGRVFANTEGSALFTGLAFWGSLLLLMINGDIFYLLRVLVKKLLCREPIEAVCLNGYFTDEEKLYKNDYLRPEELQFEIDFHGEKRVIKSKNVYTMIYERNTSHILMINSRKPDNFYDPEAIKLGVARAFKDIGMKALQALAVGAAVFVFVYIYSRRGIY